MAFLYPRHFPNDPTVMWDESEWLPKNTEARQNNITVNIEKSIEKEQQDLSRYGMKPLDNKLLHDASLAAEWMSQTVTRPTTTWILYDFFTVIVNHILLFHSQYNDC
ncbi:hypothetical protein L596_001089 [Steinernema carpocapsae]|uniref:Uncharacterized protein n=1 Tax=Steinernema carpocapsae TaxID=34508 RepID=A0A4U8UJY3_STECR|nr:hypothetical protein L596_001089 [Steinernema carpocapsae]